ncbi:AAA family ATPase [Nocardiopsis sediminis]|uniref:AAA family ATPase n=1 Tax=Nocardiopsis sediminis TaxID=1778267 RepID=A0ABV8FQB4_9ACTN
MTTAAHVPGRTTTRPGGAGRAPHSPSDDRNALRRVDWAAPTTAAFYRSLEAALEPAGEPAALDPVRNPFAPGAGQRPPELAGRERELQRFGVVLERAARGRPERGVILTGMRGVGKTVLLTAFRAMAARRGWGTGRVEARPGRSIRPHLAAALHTALRDLAPRHRAPERVDRAMNALAAFAGAATDRPGAAGRGLLPGTGPEPPVPVHGRAGSGDPEAGLTELFAETAAIAADLGTGIALFIDEMQDLPADDLAALCTACHELAQTGGPLLIVGAGLPQLPALLAESRGYAERLFRYTRVEPLGRAASHHALVVPARLEGVAFEPGALDALYEVSGGYPFFVQTYAKATWDIALRSPISAGDVAAAVPDADDELAAGFFSGRYERATAAERSYMRAMAAMGDRPVRAAEVATALGRPSAGPCPALDTLIHKGLVHSAAHDTVAFTVPHFARYLRRRRHA